jgi:hypothetical protein
MHGATANRCSPNDPHRTAASLRHPAVACTGCEQLPAPQGAETCCWGRQPRSCQQPLMRLQMRQGRRARQRRQRRRLAAASSQPTQEQQRRAAAASQQQQARSARRRGHRRPRSSQAAYRVCSSLTTCRSAGSSVAAGSWTGSTGERGRRALCCMPRATCVAHHHLPGPHAYVVLQGRHDVGPHHRRSCSRGPGHLLQER